MLFHRNLLIYSLTDGHLCHFQLFAIINNVAMNKLVHVSLSDLATVFCMHLRVELVSRKYIPLQLFLGIANAGPKMFVYSY